MKENMKTLKKILCLTIMVLSVFATVVACKDSNEEKSSLHANRGKINKYGNSSVNIIKGGEIAFQDGWYYYNNGKGIYKSKEDGTEREQVTLECGNYINVVGDWLYFSTKDGIRKIKTDGTEYCFVSPIGEGLLVIDDWIYFYEIDDGMYKVKIDGTEQEQLVSGWAPTQINVDEDYIYYRFKGYGSDNDNGIYRIKKDGTDNTLIYAPKDLSMVSEISPIMLKNNWLYFYKPFYDSTGVKELCRVKNDGSKVESIYTFENKKEYIDDYNNILNDKFFWSSVIYSEDDVLDSYDMGYKISLDGKNKAEIGSTTIYDYALNDKFIKKIKDGNFVKFEIYDNQDNKISTLE